MRQLALALVNLDGHRRLIVFSSREGLRKTRWDGGVFRDHFGHHAAHGFNTQRQRRHIQEQDIRTATAQNLTLNRRANSNSFIRVHIFAWLFAKELFYFLLHFRHARHTANQDHIVDVGGCQARVFQSNAARCERALNQLINQAF